MKASSNETVLSKSIARQAKKAGELRDVEGSEDELPTDEDAVPGYYKITLDQLEQHEDLCQRFGNPMVALPPGRVLPGKGVQSGPWWRALFSAYRAIVRGTRLTEHNIHARAHAIKQAKAVPQGVTPVHTVFYSEDSDSDNGSDASVSTTRVYVR